MRGWRKVFQANGNQKKAGVAILISDKIDFKTKTFTRDKDGHSSIYDQGINPRRRYNNYKIHAPSIGASQYIKKTLTDIKGEIDSNTIIVGDFNAPLNIN